MIQATYLAHYLDDHDICAIARNSFGKANFKEPVDSAQYIKDKNLISGIFSELCRWFIMFCKYFSFLSLKCSKSKVLLLPDNELRSSVSEIGLDEYFLLCNKICL